MDYKEKYNAALERMKSLVRGEHPECFSEAQKAAEFIFPELAESEDERIRKKVIEVLKLNIKGAESQMQASRGVDRCFEIYACNKVIAWLEKQKNTQDKEYVFRPLAGEAIEKAVERAVKLDGKVVLAFNGAYIPVGNKTKDEIVAEYYDWIKKQGVQTHVTKTKRRKIVKPKYIKDAIIWSRHAAKNGAWVRVSDINYIESEDVFTPGIHPVLGRYIIRQAYPYEDWMEEYIGTNKDLPHDERFKCDYRL